MKLLHCSDIHLGRRPIGAVGEFSQLRYEDYFNAFNSIVEYACGSKIDVFLIAGDFFDKKEIDPDVLERCEIILKKLESSEIPVVLIEGNHDNVSSGRESDSWLVYLENKGLLKRPYVCFEEDEYRFKSIQINDYIFYGLGFQGAGVNEVTIKLSEYLSNEDKDKNIVLIHTAIGSDEFMPGAISTEALNALSDKALYVGGGHYHRHSCYPSANPFFFVPGSPEYWDLGEIGQNKGFIVFDTDTKTYEFYESTKRSAFKLSYDIVAKDCDEFRTKIDESIGEADYSDALIYLELKCDTPAAVDADYVEQAFMKVGAKKAKIKYELPGYQFANLSDSKIGVAEIETEIIKSWSYFSGIAEETSNMLQKLKEFQAAGDKNQFTQVFDDLIELAMQGGENENK